ncbi:MAG: phosphate ABC transporter permease subunit PstC [Anaerolineae bacterium]
MQNEATIATSKGALRADAGADVRADVRLALRKRRRPHETVIHGLLLLCGAVSILTTLGIAFGLVQESLSFFTRELWEDANKRLVVEVDAQAATLQLSSGGLDLEPGAVIRIDDEKMRIVQIRDEELTVERGFQGTERATHQAGTGLFVSDRVSLIEFLTGTKWNPQIGQFGIWPLVVSTLRTSTIAVLVAMPLGLGAAIYLSEYASSRARSIIKPVLEVLSGIPTVVYGYFALVFMTQLLRSLLGADTVQIYNTASAGIVIGILILPLVSSMSEDALSAVPRSLREGAYAMGATKWETAVKVVVPAALSGIAAAFIVSISRAIGETMIVAIAAGAGPNFTLNPFDAAETMTGHIVRISGGDLSYDSIDYNSIFAIGLVLFLMTLGLNVVSQRIVRRFREVYE